MRTHRFTFKKTKRVKVVEKHDAISIDLTKDEAAEILFRLLEASTLEEVVVPEKPTEQESLDFMVSDVIYALQEFVDG